MSTSVYDDVLSRAQHLEPADQLRLIQELVARVQRQMTATGGRSIRELRGLGKDTWAGIDAQAYVDAERAAWSR